MTHRRSNVHSVALAGKCARLTRNDSAVLTVSRATEWSGAVILTVIIYVLLLTACGRGALPVCSPVADSSTSDGGESRPCRVQR
jgi:hypothetical protein